MTGWRTLIASAIVAALGVMQGLDWVTLVNSPKSFGWAAAGGALLFAVLRAITTTPVGQGAPATPPAK